MSDRWKAWIVRLARELGVHMEKRTPDADLASLIRSLRPLDSGVELIRLGGDGDGGYLIPDDLEGIRYAFSPGVSMESSFEASLADRGIEVFLADNSVEGPAVAHPRFVFDRKHVGCFSDERFMTLDEWKSRRIPEFSGDLLLQMDIEGGEYETLFGASAALLAQFRIMLVEFHDLHELLSSRYFRLASRLFRKLLRSHGVVHIHPNNHDGAVRAGRFEIPRVAEFTFYRNDRFRRRGPRRDFPHPLDRDNTTGRPPLVLHECWYR